MPGSGDEARFGDREWGHRRNGGQRVCLERDGPSGSALISCPGAFSNFHGYLRSEQHVYVPEMRVPACVYGH